jgi:hypothetical protein
MSCAARGFACSDAENKAVIEAAELIVVTTKEGPRMARQAAQRPDEDTGDRPKANGSRRPIGKLARVAAHELAELTGCDVVGVSGVERDDDGWRVHVDVVELRRVPDTTSVLATYELELDGKGELLGYRRVRRFNRASTEDE